MADTPETSRLIVRRLRAMSAGARKPNIVADPLEVEASRAADKIEALSDENAALHAEGDEWRQRAEAAEAEVERLKATLVGTEASLATTLSLLERAGVVPRKWWKYEESNNEQRWRWRG